MKHIGESSISKPGGMWRGNPSLDQARLQVRKRRSSSFLRRPSSCMFLFWTVTVCLLAPFFRRLRSFVVFLFQQEVCRAILPTCGSSSSIRLRLCEENLYSANLVQWLYLHLQKKDSITHAWQTMQINNIRRSQAKHRPRHLKLLHEPGVSDQELAADRARRWWTRWAQNGV